MKPDYCVHKDQDCDKPNVCDFYWPQEGLCSLMPNEELVNARLREQKKILKIEEDKK